MRFTLEEKIAILRLHVLQDVPVAELCSQLDIAEQDFALWMEEICEDGVWPEDEEARFPLRISSLSD